MEEFTRKGIRSVRMDDIANKLGISKRTLYEIYSNKEELLLEGIRLDEEQYDEHMKTYGNDPSHNVIDIIIEFYDCQIKRLTGICPVFFSDINRYQLVLDYLNGKHKERHSYAVVFFERGVKEGCFRDDMDYDIATRIGNATMDFVMQTQMYREYDLKHILHNVIMLFVRGICTETGIRQIDTYLKERI